MRVRRGYPRHIGTRWLNCTSSLSGPRVDGSPNADRQGASGAAAVYFRLSTAAMLVVCLLLVDFVRTMNWQ